MLYKAQANVRMVMMVMGRMARRYVADRRVQPIVDMYIVPLTGEERLSGILLSGKLPTTINPERRNCQDAKLTGLNLRNQNPHCGRKFNNATPILLLRKT
jgi:hypothetical protein